MEVVYGDQRQKAANEALVDALGPLVAEGTLYLGYPVLTTADTRVQVDALLVSLERGLIAFQYADDRPIDDGAWQEVIDSQDRLYAILEGHLSRHDALRRRRGLAFDVVTVTLFPDPVMSPADAEGAYLSVEQLHDFVAAVAPLDFPLYVSLRSALERVTNIKPIKKRNGVTREDSRGAIMKKIEKGIANLDRWQKKAAIETPDGPQRIRGLAGSGKTVVLALKAAYLHAQHPDWNIAITYYSRSLSQQISGLVTRFSFEHSYEPPDPDRLRVLHSWGGGGNPGLYTTMARAVEAPVRDFQYASGLYGMDDAFRGICRELLDYTEDMAVEPIFDAVLIDEAQDLPSEFFRLIYRFTSEPKRIVWAYDELQRLSDSAMPSTLELFGEGDSGEPLVNIENRTGEARKDIVLEVCYRNTPWALATAHALGFGIYRDAGLVQHFDDYELWAQIGYEVVHGALREGASVTLRRSAASYPPYFAEHLDSTDAVVLGSFENEAAEDAWVAREIERNLTVDELEHDDILVVIPDTYTAKKRAARLSLALARRNIPSHNVGVNTSAEEVFLPGSVAMTQIYRAKGNEAPMVYVLDAQYGTRGTSLVHSRNILFTAITRSRAWVRITGHGTGMDIVQREVKAVQEKAFELVFTLPTADELALLRRVHRDRPSAPSRSVKRVSDNLYSLLDQLERGEIEVADLPVDARERLLRQLGEQ
ncbi:DEAD/DEAH box helicase [Naasia lichenicola]|uniref:RNA helicase n=1 Tax=Naasia lichenicola TaxID=2565933 RepID=A0A4V3WTT9_9MICO|nr:ATP-binding domain-containing protein [Naasia lichenicola]THG33267.1 RNA helicase [Naasia lichenicola]